MNAVTWCLCAHQRIQHPHGRRCIVAGCGCREMRPGPTPAALRPGPFVGYRRQNPPTEPTP